MLKKVIIFFMLSVVASIAFAERSSVDVTSQFDLPDNMKSCTITMMKNDMATPVVLYVTQCPNSKTETVRQSKHTVRVLSHSIDSESHVDVSSSGVIDLDGDKYAPSESFVDNAKTIDLNGKKYIKLK